MEIDTKTAVIVALGVILVFALFQIGGTAESDRSTGAAVNSRAYGNSPPYSTASNARAVNNLPTAVGGC